MIEENIEGVKKIKGDITIPEIKLQFHKSEVFGRVSSSRECAELLRKLYPEGTIELQEQVIVLYMNRRNEVIGYYRHSLGGVNSTIMDMKLILSTALKSLSSSIIVAHNHPSGGLVPSQEDKSITKRIKQAADLMEISFLDHLIITKEGYYSFADEGMLAGLNGIADEPTNVIANKTSSDIQKEAAQKFARFMIDKFVRRGDTLQTLKNHHRDFAHGSSKAIINEGKITVQKLENSKVDISFPLHSIYNQVLDEFDDPSIIVDEERKISTHNNADKPKVPTQKTKPVKIITKDAKEVEKVEEEVRFIKRYVLMHGKEKSEAQLLTFLSGLQRAILERKIRKTSKFKKEVEYIQNNLVVLINRLSKIKDPVKRIAEIKIDKTVLSKFLAIAGSEKVRLSVNYLKRYVGMQGKHLTKEKAERLFEHLKSAAQKRKITNDDPYAERLKAIYNSLGKFINNAKANDTLEIHDTVLNGINEILEGCPCEEKKINESAPLNKAQISAPTNKVMNSLDFAKLKFNSLGFTGKWLDLIGDPAGGFTAMVFGKPKMGKSYLCVDFAGYLARNHGDTLYVAREEKLDATLQKKLNDKEVKHRCLYVSDHLPEDLTPYQFIFLDSVNKLGLTPHDLDKLKADNPGKNFIDVHQTTKEGKFRGSNEYQHDVDIVIEVPEKGKAVQFGRFNQGGEIAIFDEYEEGLYQKAA